MTKITDQKDKTGSDNKEHMYVTTCMETELVTMANDTDRRRMEERRI